MISSIQANHKNLILRAPNTTSIYTQSLAELIQKASRCRVKRLFIQCVLFIVVVP